MHECAREYVCVCIHMCGLVLMKVCGKWVSRTEVNLGLSRPWFKVLGVFSHRNSYNVLKELIKKNGRGNIYISMKKVESRCLIKRVVSSVRQGYLPKAGVWTKYRPGIEVKEHKGNVYIWSLLAYNPGSYERGGVLRLEWEGGGAREIPPSGIGSVGEQAVYWSMRGRVKSSNLPDFLKLTGITSR